MDSENIQINNPTNSHVEKLNKVIEELNQTMNFNLIIDHYRIFSVFELKNYHCELIPSLTISIYLANLINNIKTKINHFTYYEYSTPIVNYSLTDFTKYQISEFLHRQEMEAKYFIRYIPAICKLESIKARDG